ncbi:carbon starvation induced protein CsiD [Halomonas sp.]|uniref:carbon starvation induced protein CsiD n=1 Tax=Halomonas sp. TaxID=1486246 RepID=UPI0025B99011|nr:carbon starvation induced protein CsiD [Halomonas sp.]
MTGSWIQSADIRGFTLAPSAASPRLLQLTVSREVVEAFLAAVAEWPVQALEYKSMPRFRVAKVLDDLCGNTLQPVLVNTLTHAKTLRNPRQV